MPNSVLQLYVMALRDGHEGQRLVTRAGPVVQNRANKRKGAEIGQGDVLLQATSQSRALAVRLRSGQREAPAPRSGEKVGFFSRAVAVARRIAAQCRDPE